MHCDRARARRRGNGHSALPGCRPVRWDDSASSMFGRAHTPGRPGEAAARRERVGGQIPPQIRGTGIAPSMRTPSGKVARGRCGRSLCDGALSEAFSADSVAVLLCCMKLDRPPRLSALRVLTTVRMAQASMKEWLADRDR